MGLAGRVTGILGAAALSLAVAVPPAVAEKKLNPADPVRLEALLSQFDSDYARRAAVMKMAGSVDLPEKVISDTLDYYQKHHLSSAFELARRLERWPLALELAVKDNDSDMAFLSFYNMNASEKEAFFSKEDYRKHTLRNVLYSDYLGDVEKVVLFLKENDSLDGAAGYASHRGFHALAAQMYEDELSRRKHAASPYPADTCRPAWIAAQEYAEGNLLDDAKRVALAYVDACFESGYERSDPNLVRLAALMVFKAGLDDKFKEMAERIYATINSEVWSNRTTALDILEAAGEYEKAIDVSLSWVKKGPCRAPDKEINGCNPADEFLRSLSHAQKLGPAKVDEVCSAILTHIELEGQYLAGMDWAKKCGRPEKAKLYEGLVRIIYNSDKPD